MNPIGAIAILATSGLAGLSSPQAPQGRAPAGYDPSTFAHHRLARDVGASRTDRPASVPRGYIIMIHSTFEPDGNQQSEQLSRRDSPFDQLITGGENALGAGGATRDGDYIVFRAIPYAADTVRPVVVERPQLEVDLVGTGRHLMLEPNAPPAQESICHFETSWYGSEGPVDACSVYRVPVHAFAGVNVVTFTLHFMEANRPQQRVHNDLAHLMLHMAILGAPVDLRAIDATTTVASPLVVDSAVDTRSSRPPHYRLSPHV
jgi:hypothetical protein